MDCRTCKHNSYLDIRDCDFVSCGHPKTLAKAVRFEKGDPAWVNALTGDIHVSQIPGLELDKCECWEAGFVGIDR